MRDLRLLSLQELQRKIWLPGKREIWKEMATEAVSSQLQNLLEGRGSILKLACKDPLCRAIPMGASPRRPGYVQAHTQAL